MRRGRLRRETGLVAVTVARLDEIALVGDGEIVPVLAVRADRFAFTIRVSEVTIVDEVDLDA